jgi:gamma-glutamyltranspeptidase/glutathione hydrolase
LDFAIGYARDGHPMLGRVGTTIAAVGALFQAHWPTSADLWMPGGRIPAEGELVRNPAYARTLQRLVEAGAETGALSREARIDAARSEWREGFVAKAMVDSVQTAHRHSSGMDHRGVLALADLAEFEAGYEAAATVEFRGHTIAKTGPWGQGPALLQTLAILDGFEDRYLDPSTELGAHTILEALKLALADREAYYGDTDVPLDYLLSAEYCASRRALITDRASHDFRPGSVPGREPYIPPLRSEYVPSAVAGGAAGSGGAATADGGTAGGGTAGGAATADGGTAGGGTAGGRGAGSRRDAAMGVGEPTVAPTGETRGDTCHIDVVDRWGNMVSATPSGGWLQSSPAIPELGFCLGTRLQMTWLEPGTPSTLRPGKRPRTTLTPTLVLRGGRAVTALGSPGGDQQDQWQLPYLLRTIVGGYSPQQAIDAPTFHTTSMPGSFWPRTWEPGGAVVEDRLGEDVIVGLERRGHIVTRAGGWTLGRLSAVVRDPETGVLQAAANPRGAQGYAAGR